MSGKAVSDKIGIGFIFIKNLGSFVKPDLIESIPVQDKIKRALKDNIAFKSPI